MFFNGFREISMLRVDTNQKPKRYNTLSQQEKVMVHLELVGFIFKCTGPSSHSFSLGCCYQIYIVNTEMLPP